MTTKSKRIIYARGFPYGAPMIWLRGGGTRDPEVREYLKLKEEGKLNFWWDGSKHAWEGVVVTEAELLTTLRHLRDMGYEILPKEGMRESYIIDLEGKILEHIEETGDGHHRLAAARHLRDQQEES